MDNLAAYRLVKRKWKDTAFDGEGAKRYGGRWNSKGKPVVYLASSESLAMLEIMVHINHYPLLRDYVLLKISLPHSHLLRLKDTDLPEGWREDPAPEETAHIGDYWLQEGLSLALDVPSAVIPRERNFLLNPEHEAFESVVTQVIELDFEPDKRLFG